MWHDDGTDDTDELLYLLFVAVLAPGDCQTLQYLRLTGHNLDVLQSQFVRFAIHVFQ